MLTSDRGGKTNKTNKAKKAKKVKKTTTVESIARTALKQYKDSGKSGTRDTKIIKSASEIKQLGKGLKKPLTPTAGSFSFQNKYGQDDKTKHETSKDKKLLKGNKYGQFGGVAQNARKTYEDSLPKTMVDYANFSAKRDTTTDLKDREYYNNNTIDQKLHDNIIGWGNHVMTDNQSVTDWILAAGTEEERRDRVSQVENYLDKALVNVPVKKEGNYVSTESQFSLDSELPPWIQPNQTNLDWWDYYKTYSHEVVQSEVDSYLNAQEEARKDRNNPYKSAFSSEGDPNAINSYLDILIKSRTVEDFQKNVDTYWNEYVINPIKRGKLLTAAGNSLWNLMESIDVATRGIRAFAAGDTVLGGSGKTEYVKKDELKNVGNTFLGEGPEMVHRRYYKEGSDTAFEGQNVYWAKIPGHVTDIHEADEASKRAQKKFMDNGGYELLMMANPNEANKSDLSKLGNLTEEELINKLDKAFADSDIDWRDIYNDINEHYFSEERVATDLKQGVQNVREAYSEPGKTFYADTGSLVGDIILESVLDPGLLAGGIAKSTVRSGVRSAAEGAVTLGFKSILLDDDAAKSLARSKQVRAAIGELIGNNEGKNIIFKNPKAFEEDIDLFIRRLGQHTDLFDNPDVHKKFKDTVTYLLVSKQRSINAQIADNSLNAIRQLDSKIFKAAYYMDKAIDGIDSAIIKSSFFLPWASVKGVKAGMKSVISLPDIQHAFSIRRAKREDAAKTLFDEMIGDTNVTRFGEVLKKQEQGLLSESDVRYALQHVVDQFDFIDDEISGIIPRYLRGDITDEEALRLVNDAISHITGNRYKNITNLAGFVDSMTLKYRGDLKNAYDRIYKSFSRLQEFIDRRSEKAVEGFLDEVRQIESLDELRRLFREHMDNDYILNLRDEIIENAAKLNLTKGDIDSVIADLSKYSEAIKQDIVEKGIKAVSNISSNTFKRVISFDDFNKMLKGVGLDYKEVLYTSNPNRPFTLFDKYFSDFMSSWSQNSNTVYTVSDALKVVDRMERKVHMKVMLNPANHAAMSGLAANQIIGQFSQLRREIKRIDVISLKDAKVVTLLHMDRMALHQEFRNSKEITTLYGSFYDDVIDPIVKQFRGKTNDEIELMGSSLFHDIDTLAKNKYGFDRTTQLIEEAKNMASFSDDQLNSFLNVLATNFNFRDELGYLAMNPRALRKRIEATLRAQTGDSKLGMKNITDILQTAGSENPHRFLKPYEEELSNPAIKSRFDEIVNKDVLDPTAYVEKQMLFTVLADPSVITEWNALARKGRTPIAMHINTTGLNSELNSITSVSFRKWTPIDIDPDDPQLLEKLLDALDTGETTVLKRNLTDADINSISQDVIRKLDIKDSSIESIAKRYRRVYQAGDGFASEQEMLEEACRYIGDSSIVKKSDRGLRAVAPTLVVHDLDGFNIQYFNNKVANYKQLSDKDSKLVNYLDNVALSAKNNSCNTYRRLAEQAGDFAYTDEQFEAITKLVGDYIDDINRKAPGYRFMDMRTYSDTLDNMEEVLTLKERAGEITDLEKQFLDSYGKAGGFEKLADYKLALRDITNTTINPRAYAFTSTGLEENATKAALKAAGRTSVNVDSRIYIDNVLSYFNLDTEDGFYVAVEDLKKMHDMASNIIRTRDTQIVAGAEEFLLPQKANFDRIIQSCINIARNNSVEATELAYLQNMKIPDSAVESYLMARKLYRDHLHYWIYPEEDLALKLDGRALDKMKNKVLAERIQFKDEGWKEGYEHLAEYNLHAEQLFRQACDYTNNYRRRFFDELVGGGFGDITPVETYDVLDLLEGAHAPEIFNWANVSTFEKTIVRYRDGVMSEGLDLATRYSEAGSEVSNNIRQLSNIDAIYTSYGINRAEDRRTAMLYTKAKRLFDILDQNGFAKRESFQDFINRASEIQRLQLQQDRYAALKIGEKFDRNKLLSELAYNGFNMTVFNAHNYEVGEMIELRDFVKGLQKNGDDFISYYEDGTTGNVFIYLNNKATVSEAGEFRYINKSIRIERPVRNATPYATFDELKKLIPSEDIDDYREIYDHLLSCWEDTRILSLGQINGTTGRTVSRKQAEEFMASLPSNMNDWCTSEGLLKFDIARDVVYDPGFVINDSSDMVIDYLGTLKRQAEIAKDDCIMIREMFTSDGDNLQLNELAERFTDEELMHYFGNNPDFVVCTVLPSNNTKTGLQLRQVKMDSIASVQAAKQMSNTTILPYSVYYDVANYMNQDVSENIYKTMLGKYLQTYKAFALVKPGTWMRNYIDATMKAGLDNGQGISGIAEMVQYEALASKYLGKYGDILATDPSLLNKANWDIIQHSFKTDMTYEDFELIKGVIDGKRYSTADKKYLKNTVKANEGFETISGRDIGLRNLDEKSFNEACKKYLVEEPELPLSLKEFKEFYYNKDIVLDEATNERYEEMFRMLSNNLRNANVDSFYDKTINTMFKPFGGVEDLVRTAQTLYLRDLGFSQNQITKHIHATQFYTAPAWGTFSKLEAIMPFITFKYNNIKYWIKMMDENPRFFKYFEDIYGSIADGTIEGMIAEGQQIDYENDYALRSGAIPIGSGKVYLNINNSFLGALNDFYGITNNLKDINPLLRDTVRGSMYAFGFSSNQFFSGVDLDVTDEDPMNKVVDAIPGASFMLKGYRTFSNIVKKCTEDGGPTMDTLYSTLNFLGVLGIRNIYKKDGNFDFNEWQDELALSGQWYDCNQGKIVDISEKNEYGANDPHNTFEDVQNYMLVHFGKLWDANQHKFVSAEEYQEGGFNDGFDFENDPEAWNKLCAYMAKQGKVYDYNQRKFVLQKDYISGGLNNPDLDFDTKVMLMEEKFPNLKWDANQGTFVEVQNYIAGGLNDTSSFREVMSLRLALYGETYNKETKHFEKTADPSIVLMGSYVGQDVHKEYNNYFSELAIPRLWVADGGISVNSEGLLVTKDGKYIITGNAEYDAKVFDKFKHTFDYKGRGRSYDGYKRHSYNKTVKSKKPYHPNSANYMTGWGWNEDKGYYRLEYAQAYQYHNPQADSFMHHLIQPPKIYPYGGGYGKFSFHNRY